MWHQKLQEVVSDYDNERGICSDGTSKTSREKHQEKEIPKNDQ